MEQYQEYNKIFKNWNVKRLIGSGSFGQVFELERVEGNQAYKSALKVIVIPQNDSEIRSKIAEGESHDSIVMYYRGVADQLMNENRIMAELKGHSNIVSYEDHEVIYHEDGIGCDIFIRMELLTCLVDYMAEHPFDEKMIINLGIDMCKALEVCDKKNIIHRDIKPGNIFVSDTGDFKLGDFGIARTIEKTIGGLSKKGTYRYMAPEVYRGEAYGKTVDICSLGLVLYYLANGNRTPFLPPAPTPITFEEEEPALLRRMNGEAIPLPRNASPGLAQIILKACAYNPQDRYGSASELRGDLEALAAGGASVGWVASQKPSRNVSQPSQTNRTSQPSQTNRTSQPSQQPGSSGNSKTAIIIVAAIVAVLVGIVGFLVFGNGGGGGGDVDLSKNTDDSVDLRSFLNDPVIEGYEGMGFVNEDSLVDEDAIYQYLSTISDNDNRVGMEELLNTLHFDVADNSGICNGDSITVIPEYDESIAASNGFSIIDDSESYDVQGLTRAPSDLFDIQEFEGSHYGIFNPKSGSTWHEAKNRCEQMGGHLIIITSGSEESFMEGFIEENKPNWTYHYWLGASDEDEEGTWKWVNGDIFWVGGPAAKGGHSVNGMYENWLPSQPNNSVKESPSGHDYLEIQVTNGNEAGEYMTWTDLPNDGVAFDYEGPPDYNSTRYYGFICEWD